MLYSAIGSLSRVLLGGAAVLTAFGVYKVLRLLYLRWTDPLRILPGPPNPNFLWGHMKQIYESVRNLWSISDRVNLTGYIGSSIITRRMGGGIWANDDIQRVFGSKFEVTVNAGRS